MHIWLYFSITEYIHTGLMNEIKWRWFMLILSEIRSWHNPWLMMKFSYAIVFCTNVQKVRNATDAKFRNLLKVFGLRGTMELISTFLTSHWQVWMIIVDRHRHRQDHVRAKSFFDNFDGNCEKPWFSSTNHLGIYTEPRIIKSLQNFPVDLTCLFYILPQNLIC